MKKLILLLLAFIPLLGMTQFSQGVGAEYYTTNQVVIHDPVSFRFMEVNKGDFAILYSLSYKFSNLEVSSLAEIFMNKTPGEATFGPTHSEYTIGIIYKFKKFKIKASHKCYHPIITDDVKDRMRMTGAYTKIGIYYNIKGQ